MSLSLHKLREALAAFKLEDKRVEDIMELLRFCYDDIVPDQLRSLVGLYVACKVDELWGSSDFREFTGTHGELSVALIELLLWWTD
jgi:hypothetical protein